MTETFFYLERRSLDDVLPRLIEKTLDCAWQNDARWVNPR
jgi:hypothetical protein